MAVVELDEERERDAVLHFGFLKALLLLRDGPELVVGAAGAVAVVELQLELERFVIVRLRLLKAPLLLRDDPELVIGAGRAVAVVELEVELERRAVVRLCLLGAPLFQRDVPELDVRCGRAVAVVELEVELERFVVVGFGLVKAPLLLRDSSELVVGVSRFVAVVELEEELERFVVVLLGLFEASPLLRDGPELVIGGGRAAAVVELDEELERRAVVRLGLLEAPLLLRDGPELVIGARRAVAVVELEFEGEFGFVVVAGVVEPVLLEGRDAGEVVEPGELCAPIGGHLCRDLGDGVFEELAAGVLLVGLVEVFLEREHEPCHWLAVADGVIERAGQVGVFGLRERASGCARLRLAAEEQAVQLARDLEVEVVVGRGGRELELAVAGQAGAQEVGQHRLHADELADHRVGAREADRDRLLERGAQIEWAERADRVMRFEQLGVCVECRGVDDAGERGQQRERVLQRRVEAAVAEFDRTLDQPRGVGALTAAFEFGQQRRGPRSRERGQYDGEGQWVAAEHLQQRLQGVAFALGDRVCDAVAGEDPLDQG